MRVEIYPQIQLSDSFTKPDYHWNGCEDLNSHGSNKVIDPSSVIRP